MGGGDCIGEHRYGTFPLSEKVLLGSATLYDTIENTGIEKSLTTFISENANRKVIFNCGLQTIFSFYANQNGVVTVWLASLKTGRWGWNVVRSLVLMLIFRVIECFSNYKSNTCGNSFLYLLNLWKT